jgi:hypothetical protein
VPITSTELVTLIRTDPGVRAALRTYVVGLSSDITEGRVPGFGAGQNDTFTNRDNVDPTGPKPMNLPYLIPSNNQRLQRALLSWKLLPYRTYDTTTAVTTAGGSPHNHGVSGQTAGGTTAANDNVGHTHLILTENTGAGAVMHYDGITGAFDIGSNNNVSTLGESNNHVHGVPAMGVTGATSTNESTHTHSVTISATLGIREGATASSVTLSFDGVDHTATLGGPFNGDQVELDVTQYIDVLHPGWHNIALGSATLGQIHAHLRLSFYSSSAGG